MGVHHFFLFASLFVSGLVSSSGELKALTSAMKEALQDYAKSSNALNCVIYTFGKNPNPTPSPCAQARELLRSGKDDATTLMQCSTHASQMAVANYEKSEIAERSNIDHLQEQFNKTYLTELVKRRIELYKAGNRDIL